MSINTLYTVGSVVLTGTPSGNLDGIEQVSVDPAIELAIMRSGGQVDPTHVSVMQQTPLVQFTCNDIATALGMSAMSGVSIRSAAVTSLDVFFTKMDEGGTRASGSVNGRVRIVEGMMVPRQLTVNQGEHATLTYDVIATYDGTNNPFQYSFSVALPHVPSVDELFTLGKISINGTTLTGCKGWTLDFGLELVTEYSCGNVFPTFVGIGSRGPSIEIRTVETPYLNTFGLSGTAQTTTDSVLYLQKQEENQNRLSAATAEHISFTMDDGIITVGQFGGSNGQRAEGVIRLTPSYDGTNAVLVVNTATAIT